MAFEIINLLTYLLAKSWLRLCAYFTAHVRNGRTHIQTLTDRQPLIGYTISSASLANKNSERVTLMTSFVIL